LQPLDFYFAKSTLKHEDFFTPIIGQVDTYQDYLIALPVYNDCGLLYFRKDLLDKYGFAKPETWDELIACARSIQKEMRKTDPQFYGFAWQGAQYEGLVCTFLEFAASHHGGLIDQKNTIALNTPQNIAALKLMVDLLHKHRISPPNTFTEMKEEEVRIFFENGHALFERNWPYAYGLHTRNQSPIKDRIGVCTLPGVTKGISAATLGGWHVGISLYSDTKKEAFKLVEYIVSRATQKQLVQDLGWNPGRIDIYEDPDIIAEYPHVKVLEQAFTHSVSRPNVPYYTQISEVLQRSLNAALAKKMSPEQALARAQQEIDKIAAAYDE
jgi:multiple sugar transport system substrate-binding protein